MHIKLIVVSCVFSALLGCDQYQYQNHETLKSYCLGLTLKSTYRQIESYANLNHYYLEVVHIASDDPKRVGSLMQVDGLFNGEKGCYIEHDYKKIYSVDYEKSVN